VSQIAQLSPEWFEARSKLLTASDFGAAIGFNPYCSRQELFRRKTGESVFEGNEATDWGSAHEADAIFDYEAALGVLVRPSGLVVNEDYGASPDGLVGEDGTIEAKCPFSLKIHQEIPAYYMAQIQGVVWLTGRDYNHFISWTPDGMAVYYVPRHSQYIDWMRPLLADFVRSWRAGTPPKRRKSPIPPKVDYERII